MKAFILGMLAALAAIPGTLFLYFALGFAPVQSDAKPGTLETSIMQSAVRASVHRRATDVSTAHPVSDEMIVAGGKLYVLGCAGCHGELGKPYAEDRANYPPVPQLRHTGTQYSRSEIAWIIKHGIRFTAMSAYGQFYKEEQLWELAAFVEQMHRLSDSTVRSILQNSK